MSYYTPGARTTRRYRAQLPIVLVCAAIVAACGASGALPNAEAGADAVELLVAAEAEVDDTVSLGVGVRDLSSDATAIEYLSVTLSGFGIASTDSTRAEVLRVSLDTIRSFEELYPDLTNFTQDVDPSSELWVMLYTLNTSERSLLTLPRPRAGVDVDLGAVDAVLVIADPASGAQVTSLIGERELSFARQTLDGPG